MSEDLLSFSAQNGYGSKLNHQELDHRFWFLVPFSRVPCCVTNFDHSQISHVGL